MMTTQERKAVAELMGELKRIGTRLTNERNFHPNREMVIRANKLLNAIEKYNTAQREQNTPHGFAPKFGQKECPFRGPSEMTCRDCRSLQKLYGEARTIEDILITHKLIERQETHQLLQAGCGTANCTDTYIRIVFQDPLFRNLPIMEWFSPLGNTWVTVISIFLMPFLMKTDWTRSD